MILRRSLWALARPFLVLLLLTVLAACSSRVAPPEPPVSVRRGDTAFAREDYDTAIAEYRIYLDAEEQGVHTPRTFYKSALASYRLGHYAGALATLDELAQRYPNAQWVQADALRGDCQHELGRPMLALGAWDAAWPEANDIERPKLRGRITTTLDELDPSQFSEAERIVENDEVKLMVAQAMTERATGRKLTAEGRAAMEIRPVAVASDSDVSDDPALQPRNTLVGTFQRLNRDDAVDPEAAPPALAVAAAEDEAEVETEVEAEVEAEPAHAPPSWAARPPESEVVEVGEDDDVEPAAEVAAEPLEYSAPPPPAPVGAIVVPPRPPVGAERAVTVRPTGDVEMKAPPPPPVVAPKVAAARRPSAIDQMAKLDPGEDFSTELRAPAAPKTRGGGTGGPALLDRVDVEPVEELAAEGARVGVVVPLTGKDRNTGEHVLRGLRLVFGDFSERLVIRDSGSNPAVAGRLLKQLAQDETIVLAIGATGSQEGQSLAQVANQAALPLLLLSDEANLSGGYVVQVRGDSGQPKSEMIRALLAHVMDERRLRQFGVFHPNTKEGAELAKLFRAEVGRRGGKVIASESYEAGAPGVSLSAVSDWQEKGVQAVFVPDDAAKVAAFARLVQRQAPELWLIGIHGWESLGNRGAGFNGIVFAGSSAPTGGGRGAAFVERYESAYNASPNALDGQAYDAGVVARALLTKGVDSRKEALAGLDSLGSLEGAVSELNVSRKGIRRELLLLRFRDGQVQPVAPSPAG